MATATKPQPSAVSPREAEEAIESRLADRNRELEARERMLDRILSESAELTPNGIDLSPAQRLVFYEMGARNIHDIIVLLRQHKGIQELRASVGDPDVLADAKAKLAAASDELSKATAELSDMEVSGGNGEPMLAKQIRKLQARLEQLIANRDSAANEVNSIEAQRKALREKAPQWLREKVNRDVRSTRWRSELWLRVEEIKATIMSHRNFIRHWLSSAKRSSIDLLFINYAKVYLPATVRVDKTHGNTTVDLKALEMHYGELEAVTLPALNAELERLTAEWEKIVAEIEEPLDRWMRTGAAR